MARHEIKIHANTGATSEKAPFTGSYITKSTLNLDMICAMAANLVGMPELKLKNLLQNSIEAFLDWEREEACRIHIDGGYVEIKLLGSFPAADSTWNPEKNKFSYGVTSSEEIWRSTTNVTRRIASLVPVLVERTPAQPPVPTVVSGPVKDALGNSSVTALLKIKDGVRYLLAVNAADAEVKASFAPGAHGDVEVLWENRRVTPDVKGGFTDQNGCRVSLFDQAFGL